MRVIVCGSRDWTDDRIILRRLIELPKGTTVVTGDCRGADEIAIRLILFHTRLGLESERYLADWDKYGKAAGPIRNKQMLNRGADLIIAFHPDIESSKGTKHMVSIARAAGIPVEIVSYDTGAK